MSERLIKYLAQFKNKKILVIGDIMLDEHIWSRVDRTSPEAPVPVADVTSITHVPGGAANVANNIRALGGDPILIGAIGRDSSGSKLVKALKKNKISPAFLIKEIKRPTTLKSRIIAANQQVVRVDREEKGKINDAIERKIVASLKKLIPRSDAVIISDYGKGLLTDTVIKHVIRLSKKNRIPVSADPKGADYRKYRGVTVITPNNKEAQAASKIEINDGKSLLKAGKQLLQIVKSDYVLITRGNNGMSLFTRGSGKAFHIPAIPREVFDITGAGDTVISALTLSLASGIGIKDSVVLSNYAASVAITKVGTAPVYLDELGKSLSEKAAAHKKIKSRFELKEILKKKKQEGSRVVFTNGCFDLLHVGHIRYLEEAKKYGDILVIGLNSDSSVKKIKAKNRPYNPQSERAEILAALETVDYITIFSEDTPKSIILELKPDVQVKGGDYKRISSLPEAKAVRSYGGKVIIVPETKNKSSTKLINKIRRK
ncbi:D-glycero-beta-D-manno-heptose-7-phosphate kinase [Candidatus Margulisiibacteriota bacterium]